MLGAGVLVPQTELCRRPAELAVGLQQQLFTETSQSDLELPPQQVVRVLARVGGRQD